MAAVFTVSSCLVWEIIRSGEQEIERLYRSTVVEMEIMRKNASTTVSGHAGAYIRKKTVQAMLDTGNVSESYLVAGADGRIGKMGEEKTKKAEFIGIVDIEQYLAKP